jgi:hypothetical protein
MPDQRDVLFNDYIDHNCQTDLFLPLRGTICITSAPAPFARPHRHCACRRATRAATRQAQACDKNKKAADGLSGVGGLKVLEGRSLYTCSA